MKSKLSFEGKGTCGISEMKDSIKELEMSMSEIWGDIVEAIEMQVTIYIFLNFRNPDASHILPAIIIYMLRK